MIELTEREEARPETSPREVERELAEAEMIDMSALGALPFDSSDHRELSREMLSTTPSEREGSIVSRSVSTLQDIPEVVGDSLEQAATEPSGYRQLMPELHEEQETEPVLFRTLLPPEAVRRTVSENLSARRVRVEQDEPYGDILILPRRNRGEVRLSRSRSEAAGDNERDTENGHLIYKIGDVIEDRGRRQIALKIIKNLEKYREAAQLEINVLEKISEKDPLNKQHCVKMLEWFNYYGHVCISFELLSLSTFDFLKANNFLPYPIKQIRHMAHQIFHSVSCESNVHHAGCVVPPMPPLWISVSDDSKQIIHSCSTAAEKPVLHDNKLTHTDLKPENILFVNSDYSLVYNAEKSWAGVTPAMSGVSAASCLSTTKASRCSRKCKYFHRGRLDWNECSKAGRYVKAKCKPLRKYLLSHGTEHHLFFDLLEKMLEYEPSKRISLSSALRHPFFLYQPKSQTRLFRFSFRGLSGSSGGHLAVALSGFYAGSLWPIVATCMGLNLTYYCHRT
ncbi:hypothetical protein INR49_032151 [Caranx melampygus]|nr:hypothetical protein INR49_032151 [Caranx melampygus]